jgi:hypothetical protein
MNNVGQAVNRATGFSTSATARFARGWALHLGVVFVFVALALCVGYWSMDLGALSGIDDADITQVYARNIASGQGYVYTPGYERVEGATSMLWVLINAACFALTAKPEPLILATAIVLTVIPLLLVAWVADLATKLEASSLPHRTILYAWFSCLPAYFIWLGLTLMDQALWAAVLALLVTAMAMDLLGRVAPSAFMVWSSIAAFLAVMTRPEAAAQIPAMLIAGAIAAWAIGGHSRWRRYAVPLGTTALSLVAISLGRLCYFGYPFPNTYYAKVSSVEWDNLTSGLHYIGKFLLLNSLWMSGTMAVLFVTCLAGHRLYVVSRHERQSRPMDSYSAVAFMAGCSILTGFAIQLLEGGDHFPGLRMLQPFMPLYAIPLTYLVAEIDWPARVRSSRFTRPLQHGAAAALVAGIFFSQLATYCTYDSISREFEIADTTRRIGQVLNHLRLKQRPTVGMVAAGGIALSYRGRVLDLMGLNWVKMAHASTRRAGFRGHSAFDEGVFWSEMPDLMVPSLLPGIRNDNVLRVDRFTRTVLHGLLDSQRFKENYRPVIYSSTDGTVLFFCRNRLIGGGEGDPAMMVVDWNRII